MKLTVNIVQDPADATDYLAALTDAMRDGFASRHIDLADADAVDLSGELVMVEAVAALGGTAEYDHVTGEWWMRFGAARYYNLPGEGVPA